LRAMNATLTRILQDAANDDRAALPAARDWLLEHPEELGVALAWLLGLNDPGLWMPTDARFSSTQYVVEADDFARLALWDRFHDSFPNRTWRQHPGGGAQQVGCAAARPVLMSCVWADVFGRLVLFCHPCSPLADSRMVERWLARWCNPLAPDGELARCDAMNFHLFIQSAGVGV
jgi:hypothetical protein